jgi:hypothetical protein
MLSASEIIELHDHLNRIWHDLPDESQESNSTNPEMQSEWLHLVARQHRANFELWHIEDEARAPGVSEAELARVKRQVDQTNQRRNDLAEELDRSLLHWLGNRGLPNPEAPLNSESPGLIIDRLSILGLKAYHTGEEAERTNAPMGHSERNRERLSILNEQRADLAACLDALWRETLAGTRRFKLYRQLKMYNDPSLNPAVYRKLVKESAP